MVKTFVDRQSTHPNRYKITKENGSSEYVVLERADSPTIVGTPLTASTFNGVLRKHTPRNLLDNSDFTNLIAQAGFFGSHGTDSYLADRWKVTAPGMTYDSSTRVLTFAPGVQSLVMQNVKLGVAGKTVTLAIKASGVSGTVYLSEGGAQSGHKDVAISDDITLYTFVAGEIISVCLWSKGSNSICIDWMALYEGEYTVDTLPEYQYKGYGAELSECQRYYQIVKDGFGNVRSSGTTAYVSLSLCVPMYSTNVSLSYMSINSIRSNAQVFSATSGEVAEYIANSTGVKLNLVGTFTGAENHVAYVDGVFHLCADI